MSYQVTGKMKAIFDTKQISDTFKVREFVVTIDADGKYPQQVKFQTTQDRCESISTFALGSDVTVSFNLRGRESTGKDGSTNYWNTLDAWKVEAYSPESALDNPGVPANQMPVNVTDTSGQNDGLPF